MTGLHYLTRTTFGLVMTMSITFTGAATLLNNGDFESGILAPWQPDKQLSDTVSLYAAADCYRGYDTSGITPRGHYSAMLEYSNPDSVLTSEEFAAGDGVAFVAMSAYSVSAQRSEDSIRLEIIDADTGEILISQPFQPQTTLTGVCGEPELNKAAYAADFSSHYIATRAFTGERIRLRFRNNKVSEGKIIFNLVDQVVVFAPGQEAQFMSRPYAQAGMRMSTTGIPMLSSEGSFDPDQAPGSLRYSWYLDQQEYRAPNPCLPDLESGNYRAVLYVNDGHHAVSDDIRFYIGPREEPTLIQEYRCTSVLATQLENANDQHGMPDPVLPEAVEPAVQNGVADTLPQQPVPPAAAVTRRPVPVQNLPARDKVATSGPTVTTTSAAPVSVAPPKPDIPLIRNAYRLEQSGIRWQPGNNEDQLQIITPAHFPRQTVTLLNAQGELLDTANHMESGDQGIRYRFSRSGDSYPAYSILRVGHTDYLVSNPENEMK